MTKLKVQLLPPLVFICNLLSYPTFAVEMCDRCRKPHHFSAILFLSSQASRAAGKRTNADAFRVHAHVGEVRVRTAKQTTQATQRKRAAKTICWGAYARSWSRFMVMIANLHFGLIFVHLSSAFFPIRKAQA